MGKKYGFSLWDWRSWAFLFSILIMVFWVWFGCCYFYSANGDPSALPRTAKALPDYVNWETVDGNIAAWAVGFSLSMALVIWLLAKTINSIFNNRGIVSAKDSLLLRIPVCTDREIIQYNSCLGIAVSAEVVIIPREILCTASVKALAHDIGCLLYLNYRQIEDLARLGRYTAVHSLADLLLDNLPPEERNDFVAALAQEKDYLSRSLDAALQRRDLERQVDKLQQEIELCREKEISVTRESTIPQDLAGSFSDYNELVSGRSAAVKWFKKKANKLYWKLAGAGPKK